MVHGEVMICFIDIFCGIWAPVASNERKVYCKDGGFHGKNLKKTNDGVFSIATFDCLRVFSIHWLAADLQMGGSQFCYFSLRDKPVQLGVRYPQCSPIRLAVEKARWLSFGALLGIQLGCFKPRMWIFGRTSRIELMHCFQLRKAVPNPLWGQMSQSPRVKTTSNIYLRIIIAERSI